MFHRIAGHVIKLSLPHEGEGSQGYFSGRETTDIDTSCREEASLHT